MHYLLLGDDVEAKDAKIADLRQKMLVSADAREFDCDVLYGKKLSAEELKKSLLALPAVSSQRLVIIRNGEQFKKQHKDIVQEFFASEQKTSAVILEAGWTMRDRFVKQIQSFAQVQEFLLPEKDNIFKATDFLSSRRPADALRVLHALMDDGQHPLQIMGGLVWFWGNRARNRVSRDKFEKGLLCLQEADLNIKRSKMTPVCALEVLVAKLGALLN